jgi:hypothetical protein
VGIRRVVALALMLPAMGCGRGLEAEVASGDASPSSVDGSTADGSTADGSTSDAPAPDGGSVASDASSELPPERSSCGPESCEGCCLDGVCVAGGGDEACGSGGNDCVACPAGSVCYKGLGGLACLWWQTLDCGPANCPGCCVGTQYCYLGVQDTACGHAGQACQRCNPDTGTGTCTSDADGGGTCSGGEPCSPSTCGGCCAGNVCLPGTSDDACGGNGITCETCSATQDCAYIIDAGYGTFRCSLVALCDPITCDGCCDGLVCAVGTQDVACGTGGGACVTCPSGQSCVSGACH